jgi:hypothetical protein
VVSFAFPLITGTSDDLVFEERYGEKWYLTASIGTPMPQETECQMLQARAILFEKTSK